MNKRDFVTFLDKVKAAMGKENLVIKTRFNPVKNAMVVDSHIKNQKQSQRKDCKSVGEKCKEDSDCCLGRPCNRGKCLIAVC